MALAVVESALSQIAQSESDSRIFKATFPAPAITQPALKLNSPSESADAFVSALNTSDAMDVIVVLPKRFTTTQALEVGEKQGVGNGSIRKALADLVEQGKLEVVKQGAGRAPTIYQKK